MRSRLARIGVLATGLLALLGVTTPPAQAALVFSLTFVAQATLGSGLGYPCAGPTGVGGTTTVGTDLGLCPTNVPGVSLLPLPHLMPPNTHLAFGHNITSVGIGQIVCVGHGISPKLAGITTDAACTISATGTVAGHCGLSGGQVTGFVNSGGQTYFFDIHFNGISGVINFTGHVTVDGQNGLIIGTTVAIPPTSVLPPPTGTLGESCLNLSALTFTLPGIATGWAITLPF